MKTFYQDFKRYFTSKVGDFKFRKMTTSQHMIFWFSKISTIFLYIFLPAYFVGIGNALLGTFAMYFVMGIFLAVVFQLAHVLEDTSMISHVDNKVDQHWSVHELETTANFAMKNKVWTWLLGGLNFQVEHHLFPQISHIHYPKIAKIVQAVCDEYGVQYNTYRTMRAAFISHFKYIRQMGQA